jgi:excisionase family DNA binding protein
MTQLLTTAQLAEKLNTSKMTVLRMAKDGRIPHIKISKTEFRYDIDEVLEALRAR